MNVFNFTGNLGGDCETRYTQAGKAVVSFSVAVKAGFGENASTTWVRCSMFDKRAEAVSPYLTKGQLVGVSGEFSAREWEDKQGQKRTSIEVRVNDLTLLGKKADEPREQHQPQSRAKPQAPAYDQDDVPF